MIIDSGGNFDESSLPEQGEVTFGRQPHRLRIISSRSVPVSYVPHLFRDHSPLARKRPHRNAARPASTTRRPRTDLKLVAAGPHQWKLQYPRAVVDRADDLAEVESMIALGEIDCAIDELRWLLDGCSDLLAAHQWLGSLALEESDFALARGHFGIVFDLVREVLPSGGLPGTLPYECAENQVVFESGRGLAHCLHKLGHQELAHDVVRQLLAWDPNDPVKLREMTDKWSQEPR